MVVEFTATWDVPLLLFGIHLALMGVLAIRTRPVPIWIGGLVGLARLGYVIDAVAVITGLGWTFEVASIAFTGEVALLFWLVWWGSRRVS